MLKINEKFMDFLRKKRNYDYANVNHASLYYHLFSMFFTFHPHDDMLEYLKKEIKEKPEYWFTEFHKRFRQNDVFLCQTGTSLVYHWEEYMNDEDSKQHKALKKEIFNCKDYNKAKTLHLEKKEIENKYKKKNLHIGAHFDVIFYDIINTDKNSCLYNYFLEFFDENDNHDI